eukprot:g32963.t1
MAVSGRLAPADEIRFGDNADWMTAESVVGLFPESNEPEVLANLDDLNFSFESPEPPTAKQRQPADSSVQTIDELSDLTDLSELNINLVSDEPIPESSRKPAPPDSSGSHVATIDLEESWFYQSLGQELGPMSFEELCGLAESGALSSTDLVRKGTSGDWKPADTNTVLAMLLKAASIPDAAPETKPADRKKSAKQKSGKNNKSNKNRKKKNSESPAKAKAAAPPKETAPADDPVDDDGSAADEEEPPEKEAERWYCRIDGVEHGPLEFDELKAMAARQRLNRGDQVKLNDDGQWTLATTVTGLFAGAFPPAASPAAASIPGAAIPGAASPQAPGGAPKKPKAIKAPKVKRAKAAREPFLSNLGDKKPLVFGLGGIALASILVIVIGVTMSGGQAREYHAQLQEIYNEHKALREKKSPSSAWQPLIERAKTMKQTMVPKLEKTASSTNRADQALLFASRDFLVSMLENAQKRPTRDEDDFKRNLEQAGELLGVPMQVDHIADAVLYRCAACNGVWADASAAAPAGEADDEPAGVRRRLIYALTLPERVLRSTVGVTAGAAKGAAEFLIPSAFQNSKTYEVVVRNSLRFLTEDIGGVAKQSDTEDLGKDFAARKAVGNFVDLAGWATLAFSPVWVMAVVSDVAYGSKSYIRELADELKQKGLIDENSTINNVDDVLEAVQNATGKAASLVDTPPLSVDQLRESLNQTRDAVASADYRGILPEAELKAYWQEMRDISKRENVSIVGVSGALTMHTLGKVGTVSRGTFSGIQVAGGMFNRMVIGHYVDSMKAINERGFYETVRESSGPPPRREIPLRSDVQAKLVLLPGDGIGPEIIAQGKRVLETVGELFGHSFEFTSCPIGGNAIDDFGTALPDETLAACRGADAILLGAVGGPKWDDPQAKTRPEAGLLKLRKELQLFANLRPIRPHACLLDASPLRRDIIEGTDIFFVRELTGGIYFGTSGRREHASGEEAFNEMNYNTGEIERVVRVAAEAAKKRRGHVTSVDKANVLEVSRLWRQVAARVMAEEYPDLEYDVVLVDAMAMHLIARPRDFDVVVTGNMFGDILTDEGSMLPGSLGLLPSASLGESGPGLYEPIHGSAPDIAGRGIANPLATILAAAMLLRHSLNLEQEAAAIEEAVESVLNAGARTADISGAETALSTVEMSDRVVAALKDRPAN